MSFEQNKNAQLLILSSPAVLAGTFDTSANALAALKLNAIPGVTAYAWDPQIEVTIRGAGQFGNNKPVGTTTIYQGIRGNFDVEGTDGEKAVLAALNRKSPSTLVNSLDNKLYEFFSLCNVTEEDGSPLRVHFTEGCRVDAAPKSVGGEAKRFSFQGVYGYEIVGKKGKINVVSGDAVPVTDCTFPTGDTAAAWEDEEGNSRYALLVLKYKDSDKTITRLQVADAAAAGFYAEIDAGVTLHADDGLATGDKLLVVYLV